MSWRDRYQHGGKFRDAEFLVDTYDLNFGRRNQVHEFPLKDKPLVEDLGRKAREFNFRAYVLGDDYDIDRNKLIEAIEKPGSGPLHHPWLGSMTVTITGARESESSRRMGIAEFEITCVETGDFEFTYEEPDTAEAVDIEVEKTLAESILEFADNFDVLDQISEYVDDVQTAIEDTLNAVETLVDGITGPITDLIRAPAEMASALAGTLGNLRNSIQNPFRALDIYKSLFNAGSDTSSIPATTSNRVLMINNIESFNSLMKRVAIAEAARSSALINWPTLDEAIANRDNILDAIEEELLADMDDGVFAAMSGLRAALVEDVRVRGAKLPRVHYVTYNATLPTLVLAQQVYQDATRDAELIERNNIRHPGFVPGGQPLEVLADV